MAAEDVNGGAGDQASTMAEISAALLVVVGEPFSNDHKDLILQRVTKGLQAWDVSGVDINEELTNLANAAPTGSEGGPDGEKVINHGSEKLHVDILIQPQLDTCVNTVRSFLLSPAKHRFLLYAGHAFQGSGDWILQDDCFTYDKFASICKESDVENALKQLEGGTFIIQTFSEGAWNNGSVEKLNISKLLDIKVNTEEKLTDFTGILQFTAYLSYFLNPVAPKNLLQASNVVGNIRFSRPTLYIFPACQGDSSLFGVSGFNLLVNTGYSRKACFWDFARHLDRIDAFLLTHLSPDNIFGASTFLERKAQENIHPEIGYTYINALDKLKNIPNGENEEGSGHSQSLLVSLVEEGNKMMKNLKHIGQCPHPCVGEVQGQNLQPLTLYSKVGHGTLEMYVLNPLQDSKEMKDFLSQWSKQVENFSVTKSKLGSKDVSMPLPNCVSVCALLVWAPSDPSESITRILLPGNSPQHKIFEGLDKLKSLGIFQHASCCQDDLNAPSKPAKAKPPTGKSAAAKPAPAASKTATPSTGPASPPKAERKPAAVDKKPPAAKSPTKAPAKTSKDEKNKKAAAVKDKKPSAASSPSSSKSRTPPPTHSTPEPSSASDEAKPSHDAVSPEFEKEVASVKSEPQDTLSQESPKSEAPDVSPIAMEATTKTLKGEPPVANLMDIEEPLIASEPEEPVAATPEQPVGSPEPLPDPSQYETKSAPEKTVEEVFKEEEGPVSPPPSPVEDKPQFEAQVEAQAEQLQDLIEHDGISAGLDQADTAPISSPESEASQIEALDKDVTEPTAPDVGSSGQQDLVDLGIYDDDQQGDLLGGEIPQSDLSRSQHEEVLKASKMTSSIYEPSEPVEAGAADVLEPEALQHTDHSVSAEEQHAAPEVDQVFGGASPEGLPEPVTPENDMSPEEQHVAVDASEALMMSKNPFMCSEENAVSQPYAASDLTEESAPQASSPEQEQSPIICEQPIPDSPEQARCPEAEEDAISAPLSPTELPEKDAEPEPLEPEEVHSKDMELPPDETVEQKEDSTATTEQHTDVSDILAELKDDTEPTQPHTDDSEAAEKTSDAAEKTEEAVPKQRSLSPEETRSSSQEPPDSLTGSYSEEQVYRTSRPDEVAPLVEEEGYDDFYGMESARFMNSQAQADPQNPFNIVDGPVECGLAETSPDQAINPFLSVGGDIPQANDDMFAIPKAAQDDQIDPFTLHEPHEHDANRSLDRDSLEKDFDPLKSWGQPMGLPAPPPPNADTSTVENKKAGAAKKTGVAAKKPTDAKKAPSSPAPAGRLSIGNRSIVKKDAKDIPDKKDAPEKKDTSEKTKPAAKAAAAKASAGPKKPSNPPSLNGSMKEAPKKAAAAATTKARPATAPAAAAKAKAPPSTVKRPATASSRGETPVKSATTTPVVPFYVDLSYVPCHGDPHYSDVDFFRRIRARYYVVSALNPSPSVFNALLEAKQTWEKADAEVTIIPTYDTNTLHQWMSLHRDQLSQLKIQVAPSAKRCSIQLQDYDTSCAAYRLEF